MFYKKSMFFILSGTGNTYLLARWTAEELQSKGIRCKSYPVNASPERLEDELDGVDLVGLMTPTHGFTAPWAMIKFAMRMPRGKGCHAFCLASRAGIRVGRLQPPGMAGTATFLLALILFLKGYAVRGTASINMPSNWISMHPGLSSKSVEMVTQRSKPLALRFVSQIAEEKRIWFTLNNLYELVSGLALSWLSFLYLTMGHFFLAKIFFVNEECNSCGLCVQNCPLEAVSLKGKKKIPYWNYKCESCMRCMGYCPYEAIESSHSWMVILMVLAFYPTSLWGLSILEIEFASLLSIEAGLLINLLDLIYLYLVIFASYKLFRFLNDFTFFNRIFAYTTFTRIFKRYHAPGVVLSDLNKPFEL